MKKLDDLGWLESIVLVGVLLLLVGLLSVLVGVGMALGVRLVFG